MERDMIPPKPLRAKRCELCLNYCPDSRTCHAQYPVVVPFPGPAGQVGAAGLFPPMPLEGWCAKWEAILS